MKRFLSAEFPLSAKTQTVLILMSEMDPEAKMSTAVR